MYGVFIFIGGLIGLLIVNFFIQKSRAKRYYKNSYSSSIDAGFFLKKEKDKYKILTEETHSILF